MKINASGDQKVSISRHTRMVYEAFRVLSNPAARKVYDKKVGSAGRSAGPEETSSAPQAFAVSPSPSPAPSPLPFPRGAQRMTFKERNASKHTRRSMVACILFNPQTSHPNNIIVQYGYLMLFKSHSFIRIHSNQLTFIKAFGRSTLMNFDRLV